MNKKGLMLASLTAIVSGFSIFFSAIAVKESNPFIFTFMKNAVVAIFLFSIIILLKEFNNLKALTRTQWSKLALIGLVGGSIPFLLFFYGLKLTTGSIGSFIHKTMFVYVLILGTIFLREKIDKKIILGALLLLIGNGIFLGIKGELFNQGNLFILIATLFWAAETIISKKALKELSPRTVAFGRMFFGSIIIMTFLLLTKQFNNLFMITAPQLFWIITLSLPLLLYVSFWYAGLQRIKASTATAILSLGSPITSLLSLVFLDKLISINQIIGSILLVLGIITILNINIKNPLSAHERA